MPITLTVADMSCDGCEDIVENAVGDVHGVDSVAADQSDGSVVVEGDADPQDLIDAIDYAGYSAELSETAADEPADESTNGQAGTEEQEGLDAAELDEEPVAEDETEATTDGEEAETDDDAEEEAADAADEDDEE